MIDTERYEQIADDLYSGRPEEFVANRNAHADQAKRAGDSELASAVRALRRPTRGAWAVNVLVRAETEAVDQLLALGEELRTAQAELRTDDLRALAQRRQTLVSDLVRRAERHAADASQPLSGDAAGEVEQSLQAALADPETAANVRAGRLAQAEAHVGFGPAAMVPAGQESAVAQARKGREEELQTLRAEAERATAEVSALQERRAELTSALEENAENLRAAQERSREVAQRLRTAQRRR